jgi:biotin-(acetyl-CoA carboxylase) ligase
LTQTQKHLESLIDDLYFLEKRIRLEERERAASIVREYDAYTPYIVEKHKVAQRKKDIIDEIMNGIDISHKGTQRCIDRREV